MEVKNYFATDASGNILGSAQVFVYLAGTTSLATGLQNISGASLSNPFTAQANGLVQFQAPDNNYDMRVVKLGRDFTIRIQCFDGIAYVAENSNLSTLASYEDLESYSGPATSIRISGKGIEGFFERTEQAGETAVTGMIVIDSKGRIWKRSYEGPILASWFKILGDNASEIEDERLAEFFEYAATVPSAKFNDGMVCGISSVVIPAGVNFVGRVSLRAIGNLATGLAVEVLGDPVKKTRFDTLVISTSGADSAFDLVDFGDNVIIGTLDISADMQRAGGGGAVAKGNNFYLRKLISKNIARPLQGQSRTNGERLNNFTVIEYDITGYIRGINAVGFENVLIGDGFMRAADSRSAKTPGHNGVLLISCNYITVGSPIISDSGEHAVRIGGSTAFQGGCKIIRMGVITGRDTGGCVLKVNPDTGTLASDFDCDGVVAINPGRGSSDGNCEPVRLAKMLRAKIAFIKISSPDYQFSCTRALTYTSVDQLEVGPVIAYGCRNSIIRMVDNQDEAVGNVSNVDIGPIIGSTSATSAIEHLYQDASTARNIGNVNYRLGDVSGFTTSLLQVTGNVTEVGPVRVIGQVSGSVVPNSTCPASDNWQGDIIYGGSRYSGRLAEAMFGYPLALSGATFLSSSTPAAFGTLVTRNRGPEGQNLYGGANVFTRLNSTRRGAAVAIKQTGAVSRQNGVALLGQNVGGTGDETLIELLLAKHTGTIYLPLLPTFATNAAAITGGLVLGDSYKTSTGELRIVV